VSVTLRRVAWRCALGLALAAPAAAAGPANPVPSASPGRLVSLAPSVTETLFALGVGSRVVGVSTYCDEPPEVRALPKVGSFLAPNVEAIVALAPAVVIGVPSPSNHDAVAALERLGVRVVIVDPEHLADLPVVTRRIAAAAGVPAAGEQLVATMEREMAAVRARVAGAPRRRVLMVVGQDPLVAVGPDNYLGELLEAARAENVAPPSGVWPHLSVEVVIAADPEVVVDSSMGTEAAKATIEFWARFPSLAAVRAGRIHPFRSYHVLRPGPRLPAAFADLARVIHPERWP
jgi:iron complex transport system substrate-binding protein